MKERYFAIVNPAAGGGRCGKLARAALERLRSAGLALEVRETRAPGEAAILANGAYVEGYRNFIAVGGDGTSFEIVNGLFPAAATDGRAALGFLPLGTGNSFLRDFTERGSDYAIEAILTRRRRPCDVIRLNHAGGSLYYINTLNIGFAADVATLTNRHLKRLGELGYLVGVLVSLARLRRRPFPLRADGERDDRRCLFLAFSNSKYTGGKMMIAPQASIDSGAIEYVHW
ncbi:MAG: Transcription regulator, partial [Candidatus Acidoferrum typicum]|nr:Transcription regulator [Candidatus Acidoferrum typicum]